MLLGIPTLREYRQGLDKLQRRLRVESSGGVVPGGNGSPSHSHVGNGDPLPLPSRHSTDVVISDDGVVGVLDPEHGHYDVDELFDPVGSGHLWQSESRCARRGRELQCLPDGQVRKMLVPLLVVDKLSFELVIYDVVRDSCCLDYCLLYVCGEVDSNHCTELSSVKPAVNPAFHQ